MVLPTATEGQTVRVQDVRRRAVAAPLSEHVSVLHSRVARQEALEWVDTFYGRTSTVTIMPSGWAILGLLGGLVLGFRIVAQRLPSIRSQNVTLTLKQSATLALLPAVLTPLVAVPLTPGFLPVLIADYLVLHVLVFGVLQLGLLWCAVFGFALDRYAANFWPTSVRVWIIGLMMIGAVPYMIADAALSTSASVWRRLAMRGAFIGSLGIAVALDFENLFFLS